MRWDVTSLARLMDINAHGNLKTTFLDIIISQLLIAVHGCSESHYSKVQSDVGISNPIHLFAAFAAR